jgi:predicted transcriptional regulator
MSVYVSEAVWKLRGLNLAERLVLLRLADWASHDGYVEKLSHARIAADTEMTRQAVIAVFPRLVEKGHVAITDTATGTRTARYQIVGALAELLVQVQNAAAARGKRGLPLADEATRLDVNGTRLDVNGNESRVFYSVMVLTRFAV